MSSITVMFEGLSDKEQLQIKNEFKETAAVFCVGSLKGQLAVAGVVITIFAVAVTDPDELFRAHAATVVQ